ncbi:unnamed protein product [Merluccius merluccius]
MGSGSEYPKQSKEEAFHQGPQSGPVWWGRPDSWRVIAVSHVTQTANWTNVAEDSLTYLTSRNAQEAELNIKFNRFASCMKENSVDVNVTYAHDESCADIRRGIVA